MICINISKTIFSIVFLEHAGELRIFVLRGKKSNNIPITLPWTRVRDVTETRIRLLQTKDKKGPDQH